MNSKIYKTKLFLYDNSGEVIDEIENTLDIKDGGIDAIETAVTGLKTVVLKEIERQLLEKEQQEYLKKKAKIPG